MGDDVGTDSRDRFETWWRSRFAERETVDTGFGWDCWQACEADALEQRDGETLIDFRLRTNPEYRRLFIKESNELAGADALERAAELVTSADGEMLTHHEVAAAILKLKQ